jgi:hypothetical protein
MEKKFTEEDMIDFANWFRMWYGHPKVGSHAYDALKHYLQSSSSSK